MSRVKTLSEASAELLMELHKAGTNKLNSDIQKAVLELEQALLRQLKRKNDYLASPPLDLGRCIDPIPDEEREQFRAMIKHLDDPL